MARGQALETTTAYGLEQRSRLKKVLRPRDLILFTTSGIIGVDTIATSATNGVQAIFWIGLSCVFFAIPYALIAAEMGSTYVKEGGLYVWIKEAFHPYVASILTFIYWVSNPIWMASLAVESVGIMQSMLGVSWRTPVQWAVAFALIWLVVLVRVTYLNISKWMPNIGAVIKVVLLVGIGALAIGVAFHIGHPANSFGIANFMPTKAIAISYLPVLIYQWEGFELQSNAGQEMVNPKRDVPIAVLWSAVLSAAGYTLGVLGLLLVIPLNKLSNVSGLFDAFKTILPGSWMLLLIATMIIVALLASGTTWLMGVDRALAASGYDGSFPKCFGHYSKKYGTPDFVAYMGGIIGTFFLTLNLFFSQGSLGSVYQTLLNMAVLAGTAPYLFMFPALIIFRRRYPNVKRPFSIPGGAVGTWICILLGLSWIVVSMIFVYIPSASITNKTMYILQLTGGTVASLAIASLLYWLARGQRRNMVEVALTEQDDAVAK